MPKPIVPTTEQYADMLFPVGGVDLSLGFGMQRQGTTRIGENVRANEPVEESSRGGARPGLSRYIDQRVGANALVVFDVFHDTENTPITDHTPAPVNETGGKWSLSVPSFFFDDPKIMGNALVVEEEVLFGQVEAGEFTGSLILTATFQFTQPDNAYTFRMFCGVPYLIAGVQATLETSVAICVGNAQSEIGTPSSVALYQTIDTGGTPHVLAETAWPADFNQHTLKLVIDGIILLGYLDGVLVVSAVCNPGLCGSVAGLLMDVWTTSRYFRVERAVSGGTTE